MKPRDLIPVLAATALAVTGLVLTGCGGPTGAAGPEPVAVPGPVTPEQLSGVTLRVGDQKGISAQALLKAAGLDDLPYKIEWATFTAGPPMLEAVNAGAVDVGQVGNTPPIFSAAAGGKIAIVGALRSTVGDAVLVPKDSPIQAPAELRGKRIAVTKGSSANGTLLNTLASAGLKPTDLTISYLQPGDAYAALTQGGVDAWAVWEPYVTQAGQELGARTLISGRDALAGTGPAGGTPLSNGLGLLVANRGALGDGPRNAAIADYVSRVGRANQWAAAHPAEWARLYAQVTGVPAAVAAGAAPRLALGPIPIDDAVVASEQKLADAFTAAGLIPGRVDMSGYLDRRYNDAVTAAQAGR
jgi:sulfonate transport system substrate-binding protein